MTHRYIAIVIEFEDDDALAEFQRTLAGPLSGASPADVVEFAGEMEGAGEHVHVHKKFYRMQPSRYDPYTGDMLVDVHLPTSTRWSDGTGGPNPDGLGPRRNGRRHLSECPRIMYPGEPFRCTCDDQPYPDADSG